MLLCSPLAVEWCCGGQSLPFFFYSDFGVRSTALTATFFLPLCKLFLVQGGVSTFFFPSSSWCWNSASNLIPSEVLVPSVVVY
uniref:Uncharacterized protein n=1 Tax=Physcomitrium patens TaxID=3218 RepID=A0A7I4F484_PHYPA